MPLPLLTILALVPLIGSLVLFVVKGRAGRLIGYGFALTTAANVRTLALVEVVLALLLARFAFGQRATARQLTGIGVLLSGVLLLLRAQP